MQSKFLVLNIPTYYYVLFLILILFLVLINQVYFKIRRNLVNVKDHLIWSGSFVIFALFFGLGLFYLLKNNYGILVSKELVLQYFTGYILEISLSIDNMFVILLIFSYFKVQIENQHKVLLYGVIGAILFRLMFIFLGITLINYFFWIVYILGFFLIYSGIIIFYKKTDDNHDYSNNYFINKLLKIIPISKDNTKNSFFIRENGVLCGTNLLLSLIIIEISDLIFAIDGISAIFSVSMDKFIIFTSNVFAILGLRSLYFLVSSIVVRYVYLKYAIAIILIFLGFKILIHGIIEITVSFSLCFILFCFVVSIIFSMLRNKKFNE